MAHTNQDDLCQVLDVQLLSLNQFIKNVATQHRDHTQCMLR